MLKQVQHDSKCLTMLTLPIYALLIIYALFLIIFFIFFVINLFHIILTGTTTFTSFIATFLIMATTVFVIYGTWYLLQNTNWMQTIIIWDNSWFSNENNIF